jgi:hypothetical protein
MDTAKDFSISFHAVANYSAVAVRTNRRQRMDRTLKAFVFARKKVVTVWL